MLGGYKQALEIHLLLSSSMKSSEVVWPLLILNLFTIEVISVVQTKSNNIPEKFHREGFKVPCYIQMDGATLYRNKCSAVTLHSGHFSVEFLRTSRLSSNESNYIMDKNHVIF